MSSGSYTSDSPVLTVPPGPASLGNGEISLFPRTLAPAPTSFGTSGSSSLVPQAESSSVAGRKRSRDEAAPNLAVDDSLSAPAVSPIAEQEDEWAYGEGMVLIKPNQQYVGDATSQSGTWLEEAAAEEKRNAEATVATAANDLHDSRPGLRSHKSQRLGGDATTGANYDHTIGNGADTARAGGGLQTSSMLADAPVVDDFTLHLGIGWRLIGDEEHIQAAARGWARYIENHYPLSGVTIRLESKGLQSYLVEAAEGFFLFSEDLRQGRLVSQNVQSVLECLRATPPTFEGSQTMFATETPAPVEPSKAENPLEQVASEATGMGDVDMS